MARKSDRCGDGGKGTPPKHLATRQSAYEKMANGGGRGRGGISFSDTAFHKPGSNKK